MSYSDFIKPYPNGYEDGESGGTPVTAEILNSNYDAFLIALNSWASDVENDIGGIQSTLSNKVDTSTFNTLGDTVRSISQTVNTKSTVSFSQILSSGTKIGAITIDNTQYDLYAPSGGGGGSSVAWTQIQQSGTKIAEVTIDGISYDVYSPTLINVEANPSEAVTAGDLTKLKVGNSVYSISSGGGSYEPNGVTYTISVNPTDETVSGQTLRSIVVNQLEDGVQTDTGSLSYQQVMTTGPNNFTVGNIKTTCTIVSGTTYWVITVVDGIIAYDGTNYETGDEILRTQSYGGSALITFTGIEEMEESQTTLPDYSTIEHKLGRKWIDGNDLYEITVVTNGNVPSGGTLIQRIVQTGYDTLLYTKSS